MIWRSDETSRHSRLCQKVILFKRFIQGAKELPNLNLLGDCMKKWERFTRQEIEQFVKESFSYAQLAKKIGYDDTSKNGNAYRVVRKMIEDLDLDISHFKGQGWNKDNFDYSRFTYGKKIKSAQAVDAIVAIRGHKCEVCGLTEWMGNPIPLEVHHIDGKELNSELSNLLLICPNCHALTDNYRGRNINKGTEKVSDELFIKALNDYPSIRQALISVGLTPKGGNYARAYELIQKYQIEKFLVGAPSEETTCVNDP